MVIKDLKPEESYKYLGVTEVDGTQHSYMWEKNGKNVFVEGGQSWKEN